MKPIGSDSKGSLYYHFFGSRLYKEAPIEESKPAVNGDIEYERQEAKRKSRKRKKKKKAKKKKAKRRRAKWASDSDTEQRSVFNIGFTLTVVTELQCKLKFLVNFVYYSDFINFSINFILRPSLFCLASGLHIF